MTPADLSRLSTLLDEALDLPLSAREEWLAALVGEAAALAPTLRNLLARVALKETGDLLERGPTFTAPRGPDAAPTFQAGDAIGPYHLLRLIGQGGMGEVWLAERSDGQLKRQVALKLPMLGLRRSVLVQRFARERDIVGALAHPHIARLYDAGLADDGQPYLALEYVQGQAITAYCDARQLDLRARVQLLLQVMDAVQYAHANLVIHRDLKPGNVLVTAEGQAMLLDFGIAKLLAADEASAESTELTQVGGRALTLDYASPEQIRGEPIGTSSDVYSLGVVAFELLAGARPYKPRRQSAAALEEAIANDNALLASAVAEDVALKRRLAGDIDAILNKALKKDPAERYATVNAFAEDINRWLRCEPVLAQPDQLGYRLHKFVTRNRLGVASAASVLLAVLVGAALALWQAGVARDQARLARHQEGRALAVQDFLLGLFRANADAQPDPVSARETTARQLLDVGAARVREQLKGSPDVQDAVLETLADMYVDVGLDKEAADLTAERVSVRERLYGPDDPRLAKALLDHATALGSTSDAARAPTLLQRARRIAEQAPGDQTELRIRILFGQAQAHRYTNASAALEFAREAHGLIDRTGVARADVRRAMYLEGLTQGFLGDCAPALATLQQAHALSLASPGPQAQWQIPEFTAISAVAICLGNYGLAESSLIDALEISRRVNGPDHIDTSHVLTRLMRVYLDTSRAAEAQAIAERLSGLLQQRVVKENPNLHTTLLRSLAMRALDTGRLADAMSRSAELVERIHLFTGASTVLATALQQHARALRTVGHIDEARRRLDEAMAMMRTALGPQARQVALASMLIDQAALQLVGGNAVAALDGLDAVAAALLASPAEAVPLAPQLARWRAAALRQVGRPAQAASAAQTGLDVLSTTFRPADLPRAQADLLLELGLALHASGQLSQARDALTRALSLRQANDDGSSAWQARVEIALAETALSLGDRPMAQRLASAARQRLAMHPALAPSFMEPAAQLAGRLEAAR